MSGERTSKVSASQRVGKNVKTVARARGISIRALSAAMGYKSEQVLHTRLSGVSKLSVDELDQLADILEVPVAVLLSDPSTLVGSNPLWSYVFPDETISAAA